MIRQVRLRVVGRLDRVAGATEGTVIIDRCAQPVATDLTAGEAGEE